MLSPADKSDENSPDYQGKRVRGADSEENNMRKQFILHLFKGELK